MGVVLHLVKNNDSRRYRILLGPSPIENEVVETFAHEIVHIHYGGAVFSYGKDYRNYQSREDIICAIADEAMARYPEVFEFLLRHYLGCGNDSHDMKTSSESSSNSSWLQLSLF